MVPIIDSLNGIASGFSISEALSLMKPLSAFLIGVSIYSVFIFKFYRFVAKRDIFKFEIEKFDDSNHSGIKKFFHVISYIIKHIFVLPLFIFFWFIVFAVILAFLSKNDSMQIILLISISMVSVIRIMAYYDEDLSKDLAKMLPFALLGVFLVDISYFSLSTSWETIKQLVGLWKIAVYCLVFILVLEFIFRTFKGIFKSSMKIKKDD
jgi:hypothetical protein